MQDDPELIARLKKENEILKEKLTSITMKYEVALKKVENFEKIMAYGRELEKEDQFTKIDTPKLLESVCLDPACPTISIKRGQINHLKGLHKSSQAIRYLIDCLFVEESYKGECYQSLKKHYPDKINAIEICIKKTYRDNLKTLVSKIITNKCQGR